MYATSAKYSYFKLELREIYHIIIHMTTGFLKDFTTDINEGHEQDLNYDSIDKKTHQLFLWHLAVIIFYAILTSVIKVANYFQSPFSWRVITQREAIWALIFAFVATLLPSLFFGQFKKHYYYRLLITFCFILYSYLFIFLSGGAIEAHFHFFIVIGYLAIYNDWRLGWFALLIIAFNHLLLEGISPHWLFYYGENWLSPIAHVVPILIAVISTGILARTHRQALLAQKELERRKDEFISMASHELKTPVTSIMMFIQYVQRTLHNKDITQYDVSFKRINEQVNKLSKLISDLLDVSRIEGKVLPYNLKRTNMNVLVKDVVKSIQPLSLKHKIKVKGKISKEVFLDEDRIGQVLTNLLTNAIKYSPKDTPIVVKLSQTELSAQVAVSDKGIGVTEAQVSKIFSKFYRGLGLNEQTYPGMGIGLYVSSEIIKKHGGMIWVKSEKGKGSTFYFTLPFEGT